MIAVYLLAIFGLSFILSNSDGPFGMLAWLRNKLMKNKYVGVFFFQLLTCPICIGFHAGYIVYLLHFQTFSIRDFIIWALAGSATAYIVNSYFDK